MDLTLSRLDFIEVFQFGVLKSQEWYELLNAGFQVTGNRRQRFPGSVELPETMAALAPVAWAGADVCESARRWIAIRRLGCRRARWQRSGEQRAAARNAGRQGDRRNYRLRQFSSGHS